MPGRIIAGTERIEVFDRDPFETILGTNMCGDPVVKRRSKQSIGGAHGADRTYECRPPATFHTFHPNAPEFDGPHLSIGIKLPAP